MHHPTFFECSLPSTFCDLSAESPSAHTAFTFIYSKHCPLTTYDVLRTLTWTEWAPTNHHGACDRDSETHDEMSTEVLHGYRLSKWYTSAHTLRKTQLLPHAQHIHSAHCIVTGWMKQLPLERYSFHLSTHW